MDPGKGKITFKETFQSSSAQRLPGELKGGWDLVLSTAQNWARFLVRKLLTKGNHNLKGKSYFICLGGMLRILNLGGNISVLWENCSEEAGGESGYTVCNREGRKSEHERLLLSSKENQIPSQVKEFSLLLCVAGWSLWAHWSAPFICTWAVWGQILSPVTLKGERGWWLAALAWHPLPSSFTHPSLALASSGSKALCSLLRALIHIRRPWITIE